MIAMVVRFDVSSNPSAIDRSNPPVSYPRYKKLPGLGYKAYVSDRSRGVVGGIYFWENREAMDLYLKDGGLARAEAMFGVKPTVETFDVTAFMKGIGTLKVD